MGNYKINITLIIILFIGSYINAQVIATGDTILCEGQEGNVGITLNATSYAVDLIDSNIIFCIDPLSIISSLLKKCVSS